MYYCYNSLTFIDEADSKMRDGHEKKRKKNMENEYNI